MPSTTSTPREQLRELDEQITRVRDEITASATSVCPDERAAQTFALGMLTARRIVTLQWL